MGSPFALALSAALILAFMGSPAHACELEGRRDALQVPTENPKVLIETDLGRIELEVDLHRAPRTACNFLKYVAHRAYDGGRFGRTVRPDNQVNSRIPISVIQAYANPARDPDVFGPLPLERTSVTGLKHMDGTVSMARAKVDDATSEFFICIGAQPELDFGGARHPDGQGFAAFGSVVVGMDVVRRIQQSPATGERLSPPIRIQRASIVSLQ